MRLKEGQAKGGRVDGTYNLCSGPKTPCKLWPTSLPLCPLCIPDQITFFVFCREQGELGTHHTGELVPGVSSPQNTGQELAPMKAGYGTSADSAERGGNVSSMDIDTRANGFSLLRALQTWPVVYPGDGGE